MNTLRLLRIYFVKMSHSSFVWWWFAITFRNFSCILKSVSKFRNLDPQCRAAWQGIQGTSLLLDVRAYWTAWNVPPSTAILYYYYYCTDLNFEYNVQISANYKYDNKFLNSIVLAFVSSSDRVFHSLIADFVLPFFGKIDNNNNNNNRWKQVDILISKNQALQMLYLKHHV